MLETINSHQAQQWIMTGEALLVDVREPGEFAAAHIEGATLLPLSKLEHSQLGDAQRQYIVYCQKGGRSRQACEKLLRSNPNLKVFNLSGGIESWLQAGLPIQGQANLLPLDRQVQLTIGVLLIVSTVLTLSFSSLWALVAGFVGAGLVLAGATGFCGLARVIALMPWNQKT